jgi:hypothetical protein
MEAERALADNRDVCWSLVYYQLDNGKHSAKSSFVFNTGLRQWLPDIRGAPYVWGRRRTRLFGKIRKNIKREKLQIVCLQTQVLDFFLPMTNCYGATLYFISSRTLGRCCHVGMTARWGWVSRVGGSGSEGDTGTVGNTKWTKRGKQKRLANCHVNEKGTRVYPLDRRLFGAPEPVWTLRCSEEKITAPVGDRTPLAQPVASSLYRLSYCGPHGYKLPKETTKEMFARNCINLFPVCRSVLHAVTVINDLAGVGAQFHASAILTSESRESFPGRRFEHGTFRDVPLYRIKSRVPLRICFQSWGLEAFISSPFVTDDSFFRRLSLKVPVHKKFLNLHKVTDWNNNNIVLAGRKYLATYKTQVGIFIISTGSSYLHSEPSTTRAFL